jgi:hypothetical protein
MTKILIMLFLLASSTCFAQKVQDVLEHGKKVKDTEKIFLRFDGSKLEYHMGDSYNPLDLKSFEDSVLLLPTDDRIALYIRPLNPLNYSTKAEIKEVIDEINQAADNALSDIIGSVSALAALRTSGVALAPAAREQCNFEPWISSYERLNTKINFRDRTAIAFSIFNDLKKLDFDSEDATKKGLTDANEKISTLAAEITKLESHVKSLTDSLNLLTTPACSTAVHVVVTRLTLATAVRDANNKLQDQKTVVAKLQNLYGTMKAVEVSALRNGWLLKVGEPKAPGPKISVVKLSVSSAGHEISAENKIVAVAEKENTSRLIRVRRFQRFVPEVSAGMAYTNLRYPQYGTTTDESGVQTVVSTGNENINRLNFTAMINYNLFLTNTLLHPFWQLGIGANKEVPTILSGFGVRVNGTKIKRIALSVGLAATWIKDLDKLTVGSVVTGQADVDKDLAYKFNSPKLYWGIQYNF